MEIKPVKEIKPPIYPRKEEVQAEQLKRTLPLRWVKSPAAKIALASLAAMTLTGCEPFRTAGMPIAPSQTTEETIILTKTEGEPLVSTIYVAPLFLHGEGLGAFGCVMVSPPAFLSEDEALSVINGVAKEYGLAFSRQDSPVVDGVLQPVLDQDKPSEPAATQRYDAFTPDFTDAAHGISIEFVTADDAQNWNCGDYSSTLVKYDTKEAAAQLSEALEAATPRNYEDCTLGVLYDPCVRTLSKNQLSAQVKDFCEWLKGQGII